MPIPDEWSPMLSVLEAGSDGKIHSASGICEGRAKSEGLSDNDVTELVPSGIQTAFANRVTSAITYTLHTYRTARRP